LKEASMSWWHEELKKAKDQRRGVLPQKETTAGPRHKQKRPWRVLGPSPVAGLFGDKDMEYYRGATREACERFIEKYRRSYFIPRNLTEAEVAHRKAQLNFRIAKMHIVGPNQNGANEESRAVVAANSGQSS
jgi:hypothetical protein